MNSEQAQCDSNTRSALRFGRLKPRSPGPREPSAPERIRSLQERPEVQKSSRTADKRLSSHRSESSVFYIGAT